MPQICYCSVLVSVPLYVAQSIYPSVKASKIRKAVSAMSPAIPTNISPTTNPNDDTIRAKGQKIMAMIPAKASSPIMNTENIANKNKLKASTINNGIPTNMNRNIAAIKIKGLSKTNVMISGIKFHTI